MLWFENDGDPGRARDSLARALQHGGAMPRFSESVQVSALRPKTTFTK